MRANDCSPAALMLQPSRRFETRFLGPALFLPPPQKFLICLPSAGESFNRNGTCPQPKPAHQPPNDETILLMTRSPMLIPKAKFH